MRGELILKSGPDGNERIPLDKDGILVLVRDDIHGVRPADTRGTEQRAPLIRLGWDASRCHFEVMPMPTSAATPVFIDEAPLGVGQSYAALRSCSIRILGQTIRLEIDFESPVVGGLPCEEVLLSRQGHWVFGRGGSDGADPGGIRVELDPEARRISSTHAVLESTGERFLLRDISRYGTYLNGERFKEQPLVYGDRFRIGEYVFEFLVHRIRRVDGERGGEVAARGLGKSVLVKDKESDRKVRKPILANVDLDIASGEFVGILGGSGQGKSTLMNCLCGISSPTEGSVTVNGVNITDRSALMAAGIGFVPQEDIVHRELTVFQAVSLSAKLKLKLPEFAVRGLVDSVLAKLGLEGHRDKLVGRLSGGQRKRVSIATELLARPRVLFLDEPSSGLDPATEFELMSLLQSLAATGMTVVCTTHVVENAHLFDRLLWVQGGRVVFAGNHRQARDYFLGTGAPVGIESTSGPEGSSIGLQKLASLVRIYKALHDSKETGAALEGRFRASPFHQPLKSLEAGEKQVPGKMARGRVGFWKTLRHLMTRQGVILKSDPLNLVFLLAQAVVIALLIAWVGPNPVLRGFLALVATLWFGCSNGAQQIVSELPVFQRERVSGQGRNAYILSKVGFLTTITLLQAVVLVGTVLVGARAFHRGDQLAGRDEKLKDILLAKLFPVEQRKLSPAEEDRILLGDFGEIHEARVTPDGLLESAYLPGLYFHVPEATAWKPGGEVVTPTGEKLRLPPQLPSHKAGQFRAHAVRPGQAESPFAPGAWKVFGPLERELWKPGTGIRCPLTGQEFALPSRLPPWPEESLRFRLMRRFVILADLEESVLDSTRTQVTAEMRALGISKIKELSLWEAIGWPVGLLMLAFFAAATTGVSLGLAISALVNSSTQAVMWVPLVLIPQILFGGFVVTYPEMGASVRSFSRIVPSFACQRVLDVSHVFGRLTPRSANQSKMPVFLTGERETVEWVAPDGEKKREHYDRPDDYNVSWQNLLVVPERLGKREIEKSFELIYDQKGAFKRSQDMVANTVPHRDDLRYGYVQGVRYAHVGEAQRSALVLAAWFALCFALVHVGLLGKERTR